ncbi:MAG: Three-deoxy-D-manno-octulosonic-acid transferase protein [Geminicoccaceae bacterium]|nr:Three-deoxy-D-manno-octulosonic-acid transferase protein [Geminicoccaceae bacterium]
MGAVLELGYDAAGQIARALAAVAPDGKAKWLRALRARRGIRGRYAEWAALNRDSSRRLLWMHAPSVGEGLQARPILQLARSSDPHLQLAYTFFSPSAALFARGLDVDFSDYLPFDTDGEARAALGALAPTALVFSKLDVWPRLARAAHARGVALGLVSATLAEGSSRRGLMAARLLRDAYARLDAVGAIDERDAERLVELGVGRERITVTGDTRYDQVWSRVKSVDRTTGIVASLASDRRTLVAGSTWPADERPLLAAWTRVRAAVPSARLVIAPHEPTESHLTPVEQWASVASLRYARLSVPDARDTDVVLVDRVGVLGDLYALADAAYVGGGFHAAGLHSVLEPAAFGAPVLFGPRFANSRDAALLIAAGGGRSEADADGLARTLTLWLSDATARSGAGTHARALVEAGLGAAERSWSLVASLLGRADR